MTRTIKYFLICLGLFFGFIPTANCQLSTVDSLNLALKNTKPDTTKLRLLVKLSDECEPTEILKYANSAVELADKLLQDKANSNFKSKILNLKALALNNIGFMYNSQGEFPEALHNYERGLKIQEEVGDKKNIANSLISIGQTYYNQGDYFLSLDYYSRGLKIQEEIGDKQGMAFSINNIAAVYENQGDIPKALDYYGKSLKLMEEIGQRQGTANLLNNIAGIYMGQGDVTNALDYYNRSLKIQEEVGHKNGIATALNNIGLIYKTKGDIPKALDYYNRGLKIQEETGDKFGLAHSLNNIGKIYKKQGNISKALEYMSKSLTIRKEIGDKKGIAASLNNVGALYFKLASLAGTSANKQKNSLLALSYTDSSLALSKKLGFPENIRNAEGMLSEIDSAGGNFYGAFEHYKQFIIYRDSISNKETRKAGIKNQLKYEYEKKEAVIKEHQEIERAVAEEKNRKQFYFLLLVSCLLLLVVVFAGFVFRSLRVTRHQKEIIEEKQKEILDSIHYAKRIQTALLPSEKYIAKNLKELNL